MKLIGITVDSVHTHAAWRRTAVSDGGLGEISFPLVADLTKDIARNYGVLTDAGVALRGSFLIDRSGVVRHQVITVGNAERFFPRPFQHSILELIPELRRQKSISRLIPAYGRHPNRDAPPFPRAAV